MSVNRVILIGNVGQDPRVKYFDTGSAVATFPLATTDRGYTLANGTQIPERTEWHNIVASNRLAEIVDKYVHKGDKLYLEGKIRTRSYSDQSGAMRYITEIYVDNMEMLSPKASWEGGNMRNAIPREAHAVITIPAENEEELLGLVKYCENLFNEEYSAIETPISFTAERVELPAGEVPEEIQDNLIDAIFACQNGVTRMIPTVPDTVETSSNLAIITIGEGKAAIKILARSSSDSMKEYLTTSLESCFSMAGMKVEMAGGYSGWQPDVNSPILHAMKSSYKQQFGVEPAVKVIHAGLECGIIGAIIPGLDMISFGPTLRSPHSPDERALIPTVQKFYDFLVATLEQTPMK